MQMHLQLAAAPTTNRLVAPQLHPFAWCPFADHCLSTALLWCWRRMRSELAIKFGAAAASVAKADRSALFCLCFGSILHTSANKCALCSLCTSLLCSFRRVVCRVVCVCALLVLITAHWWAEKDRNEEWTRNDHSSLAVSQQSSGGLER